MGIKILLIYIILINIFTFAVRGLDKRKATKHKRRISEKNLLIFSACGGFIGAIVGMGTRHHKTIKSKFLRKFWLIVLARIVVLSVGYYLFVLKN